MGIKDGWRTATQAICRKCKQWALSLMASFQLLCTLELLSIRASSTINVYNIDFPFCATCESHETAFLCKIEINICTRVAEVCAGVMQNEPKTQQRLLLSTSRTSAAISIFSAIVYFSCYAKLRFKWNWLSDIRICELAIILPESRTSQWPNHVFGEFSRQHIYCRSRKRKLYQ